MRFTIPVNSATDAYEQSVLLDGTLYDFFFRFNRRELHWYMDISVDDTPLLHGVKLVHTSDLLQQFNYIEAAPTGQLIINDISGQFLDPGETGFGVDVLLQYEDANV